MVAADLVDVDQVDVDWLADPLVLRPALADLVRTVPHVAEPALTSRNVRELRLVEAVRYDEFVMANGVEISVNRRLLRLYVKAARLQLQ